MALIPATARTMKNLSLVRGSDDFAHHVNDVKITNNGKPVVWKGGTPSSIITDVGVTEYLLEISLVHDYENPDSLYVELLSADPGDQIPFSFKPDEEGDFVATTTATVIPPTIGGAVDKFGGTTVKLPCTKPVLTLPA